MRDQETRISERFVGQATHFHWLDLLRFLAALTVVIAHTRDFTFVRYGALDKIDRSIFVTAAYAVTRIANEAVIVFFVLSGFLVGGRAFDRSVNGTFKPTEYAVDRFVRIMLPLFPALIITAIIRLIIDGSFDMKVFIGNLFSLQGVFVPSFGSNAPLWSLSYEVWFYILAYAVGVFALSKTMRFTSTILLIMVAAIFTSLNSVYLFCWLIGAMAYIKIPEKLSNKTIFFSVCLSIYSIIAIQIGYDSISVSTEHLASYFPSLDVSRLLLSVGIALFIQQLIFIRPTNTFALTLDKSGSILAAFSYTLYLTHYPVLQLMTFLGVEKSTRINFSAIGRFVLLILCCLITSYCFYVCFEKHTNLVKKLIKNRLNLCNQSP